MHAIEIKNLSKAYKGFKIDNLNLTFPGGFILGLIGENGAGKSTTIKLILDMVHKDSGSISILGQDHKSVSKEDIGVVMEENGLPESFNADEINAVFKNIYSAWNESEYYSYLKKFSLPLNKKIKDFSKGMKMKLYIAVALSHSAKLLILDEATSGLDPVVRDEILDIFYDFTRDENHSILISSHIVSDLEKLCDYIAFMHKGKLILFEEKDELLNNYCIIQCTEDEINDFERSSVLGIRKNEYGVSAVVKKSSVKENINLIPINLEDLFVYMIRGYER